MSRIPRRISRSDPRLGSSATDRLADAPTKQRNIEKSQSRATIRQSCWEVKQQRFVDFSIGTTASIRPLDASVIMHAVTVTPRSFDKDTRDVPKRRCPGTSNDDRGRLRGWKAIGSKYSIKSSTSLHAIAPCFRSYLGGWISWPLIVTPSSAKPSKTGTRTDFTCITTEHSKDNPSTQIINRQIVCFPTSLPTPTPKSPSAESWVLSKPYLSVTTASPRWG